MQCKCHSFHDPWVAITAISKEKNLQIFPVFHVDLLWCLKSWLRIHAVHRDKQIQSGYFLCNGNYSEKFSKINIVS